MRLVAIASAALCILLNQAQAQTTYPDRPSVAPSPEVQLAPGVKLRLPRHSDSFYRRNQHRYAAERERRKRERERNDYYERQPE